MANPEHLKILEQGVETWNQWRKDNPNIKVELDQANLSKAYLLEANLSGVNFYRANFYEANLRRSNLCGAILTEADLRWTDLSSANLREANMLGASLIGANLCAADLISANLEKVEAKTCNFVWADLSGATLTGTNLFGIAHDDWEIKGVKCDYVYWDCESKQRCPKDRDFEPGEFEKLYAAIPTIEYVFENGMSPMDPLIMDRVIQAIRERKKEFDIKIDSINARGLAPSIKFTVQNEEYKEPALEEVRKEYEIKLQQLESERDRYYQLLARALDAPKEVKLINAAPGSIVATDGSTVSVEQYIHNALELQKAVAGEPDDSESFAKVAKNTALEIVGEAIKDIAKGQVKEAAKQIIELGKDLGPLLVRTAAYVFFSNVGT